MTVSINGISTVNTSQTTSGSGFSKAFGATTLPAAGNVLWIVTWTINQNNSGGAANAAPTISSITTNTGTNPTWNRHTLQTWTNVSLDGGAQHSTVSLEVWWAVVTSGIAGESWTPVVTFGNSTGTVYSFLMNGYTSGIQNLSNPFDANSPVVHTANGNGSTVTASSSGTIASATSATFATILSQQTGSISGVIGGAPSPGFTNISAQSLGSPTDYFEYNIKSTTGSGAYSYSYASTTIGFAALTDIIWSGDAPPTPTGTIATHLPGSSQSLTGSEKFIGTIATKLSGPSLALTGSVKFSGTITTKLSGPSMALTGTDGAAQPQGHINTVLRGISQIASASAPAMGAIVTTLSGIKQTLLVQEIEQGTITTHLNYGGGFLNGVTGQEIEEGPIRTTLGRITQSLNGYVEEQGYIVTRLGGENGQLVGNLGQGEVIVQGPILMNLGANYFIRQILLGGKLKDPGTGQWQTWRYTDS